jgi:hypothetical protein
MTPSSDTGQEKAPSADRAATTRRGGWYGVGFVVLLFVSEGAVALPKTSHTTAFIAAYYQQHRVAITIAQVGQLLATVLIWRVFVALRRTLRDGADTVYRCGLAVLAASVLTNCPVLALALIRDVDPSTTRTWAGWTDSVDIVLFATISVFALAFARYGRPAWLRAAALVIVVISLARVVVGLTGSGALATVAPLAFIVFVLALSVWMIRGAGDP